ncbi:MAG: ATP-binding protein [Thiofilum sp.]|uniref:ATP-binding protein n=1 Tax=Thiofilum sp. TaxID=2212733 RepID=UPI0025D2880D|nr:ATP-binding protein [Thiofilum sp.]MBK8454220.1 ATP-binding protein [Thiofilum sp.]
MIERHLLPILLQRATQYPVVTVTGPRQSGKTTLCRQAFPERPYANLERPDTREFARTDPKAFLAQFKPETGCVIDEIQRVPELLSWIQVAVDERPQMGQFILTGSHQFELSHHITQSLAGRTTLLKLLPLSIAEIAPTLPAYSADELMFKGGYPRIYDHNLDPAMVLGDYFETYVQRDLRDLMQLRNLPLFEKFVRLSAGRIGQLLNMSSLANDVGASSQTIQEWISLLEASFILFRLPPWFVNISKRLIKTPKLYFYDVGLAAWLMGITRLEHLPTHPLRGHLFENLVVLEVLKSLHNAGAKPYLNFYRDAAGNEVDLLVEQGLGAHLLEIKAAQTVASDAMNGVLKVKELLGEKVLDLTLVYGGQEGQQRSAFEVLPYYQVSQWCEEKLLSSSS